jgi:hypothetical protein
LTISVMAAASARSDFKNFRRAGVAKNRSRTSTWVPFERAAGTIGCSLPPSTAIAQAWSSSNVAGLNDERATEPIDGNASPRKPERADIKQVIIGNLGSAVTADGQLEIVLPHAGPVIGHPHQRLAARSGNDVDLRRPGINGVFNQLLDHAGRPFNDLAGGNLVDHLFAKLPDLHEMPFDWFRLTRASDMVRAGFTSIPCNPIR